MMGCMDLSGLPAGRRRYGRGGESKTFKTQRTRRKAAEGAEWLALGWLAPGSPAGRRRYKNRPASGLGAGLFSLGRFCFSSSGGLFVVVAGEEVGHYVYAVVAGVVEAG